MVWIAAQRRIAGMAHDKPVLYRLPDHQFHDKTMHALGLSTNKNSAVAINKSAALPYKTLPNALGMTEQFA
jgi:hypothetical protein